MTLKIVQPNDHWYQEDLQLRRMEVLLVLQFYIFSSSYDILSYSYSTIIHFFNKFLIIKAFKCSY